VKEQEPARARDALTADPRRMPWLKVDHEYILDGPYGVAHHRIGRSCTP
jgi:predicted dithiol-disulfide oxidoreductase (DUF899 family)